MSEKAIVDRIISDAEQEARKIIEDAENKASVAVGEASLRAERNKIGTQAEIDARVKGIFDGQAASARLDGLKIALGERRAVIDEIYARALGLLVALDKPTALYLAEKLLKAYADDGDEIIFAENYRYAQDVMKLPVVKEKNLNFVYLKKDIEEMIADGKDIEVDCHFCNKKYVFSVEELKRLIV